MIANNKIRLAVLLSGNGSTLQYFLDRFQEGKLAGEVVLVVSNNPDAFGLERARKAGVQTEVVEWKKFQPVELPSEKVFNFCRQAKVDLVCLAGFLKLIHIPKDFEIRVMNVHPALIPAFCGKGFYGRHVHEEVLVAGVKITGCTIHFADNEYDHGPIILQRPVEVEDQDTAETLAKIVQ